MAFKIFQTESATIKLMSTDGYGTETVSNSFAVEIDPVLGYKRVFTNDGEEITGIKTIITATDDIDLTERNYVLEFNGRDYQVEQMVPFYSIGGNTLEHVEVILR